VKKTGSYDLLTEAGKVKPKALEPDKYTGEQFLKFLEISAISNPYAYSTEWRLNASKYEHAKISCRKLERQQCCHLFYPTRLGTLGSALQKILISSGTPIPDDLILVHERGDHYSLQAREEMTLDDETELTHVAESY
jgi:hypothetical protein